MLNFSDLFNELISFLSDFGDLSLVLAFNSLDLLFEIIDFFGHALHFCLVPLELELGVLVLSLSSVHFLLEIIFVVNILDPLLKHVVNRVNRLLDILGL